MALVGAGLGLASVGIDKRRQQKELKHQKGIDQSKYNIGKIYSENLYNIRKTEALDNLSMQKRNLDTQMNLSVNDYNTGLLAQAFGMQDARIQSESAIGASLAAEGASGTRGNTANQIVRDYAVQGLERNIEIQERQNRDHLNSMITSGNISAAGIEKEKASWQEGGYRHQEKAAQDRYNLQMFNLGQEEFDRQIEMSNPFALSWDNLFDYTTGGFGGASSGYNFYTSWDNARDQRNTRNGTNAARTEAQIFAADLRRGIR